MWRFIILPAARASSTRISLDSCTHSTHLSNAPAAARFMMRPSVTLIFRSCTNRLYQWFHALP